MNISQLSYIVEVAKAKSLANASKTLHVSQSALSQAITLLESELDIQIFTRSRIGVTPTKEGEKIIEKADEVLEAIVQLKQEAHNQLNSSVDLLRISTIAGLTSPFIDTYISFKNRNSPFKIDISEKSSIDIIEEIKNDVIDIGFIAINKSNLSLLSGVDFTPIVEGEFFVYASIDSELPESGETLKAEVLKEQLFALYKDEYVKEFIVNFQKRYGVIDVFIETTQQEAIIKAVTELGAVTVGHGLSIPFSSGLESYKMKFFYIEDVSDISFRFGWVQKYGNKLSKAAFLYIEEVNKTLLKHHKSIDVPW